MNHTFKKAMIRIKGHLLKTLIEFRNALDAANKKDCSESIYFYTFHKCASTLFGSYVLKNIDGLRHIDYAHRIYNGKRVSRLVFEDKGFIYGPLRLSADPASPVYKQLIKPASESDFIKNKIALFLIRDPRDIIVSSYYSFGYTHKLSKAKEIRNLQLNSRRQIQNETIDEYALESSNSILRNFEAADRLSKSSDRSVVLRYEDMIENWDIFVEHLTKYLHINQKVLAKVYEESRPRERENITSHRRSGRPSEFRSKLSSETITCLNTKFECILERFHYEQ